MRRVSIILLLLSALTAWAQHIEQGSMWYNGALIYGATMLDAATQRVGVFEGGGYQSKGVYRPAQECRMKINEVANFCPVCSRAIQRITDFYTAH